MCDIDHVHGTGPACWCCIRGLSTSIRRNISNLIRQRDRLLAALKSEHSDHTLAGCGPCALIREIEESK
jgi:hypothetical protein